jgi:ABC-2 type transport system permease protein
MVTLFFGIVHVFTGGARELAKAITKGELDYYLVYPKSVLWHVSISKTDISALGDILFGLVLFCFSGTITLEKTIAFFVISFLVAFILFNFLIITQSLSFYFGQFEEAAEAMYQALMGFSFYPQTSFYGLLKIIMMTILPAFFIVTIPVTIVKTFDLFSLLLLSGFALITFILALLVFYKGLQKYESGNLINLKM